MRLTRLGQWSVTCLASLILSAGCATVGGDLCRVSQPILISEEDHLTMETARQILVHNETGERLCGW